MRTYEESLAYNAEIQTRKSLISVLQAAYTDFSIGGKAAFGGTYDAVVAHIVRGDIAAAKLTVEMVQIPDEVPGVTADELVTWEAKKLKILALFL